MPVHRFWRPPLRSHTLITGRPGRASRRSCAPGLSAPSDGRAGRPRAQADRLFRPEAWEGRSDAFTRMSEHVAALIGARAGAAVIALRT